MTPATTKTTARKITATARKTTEPARWRPALAMTLAAALAAGCFSERTTEPEVTTPCDGTTTPCAVSVIDNSFSPRTRHVLAGSTVRWTNNGDSPHTSTGGAWDSGTLDVGAFFEHTFDSAGEFDYVCEFHDGMNGTIVVE